MAGAMHERHVSSSEDFPVWEVDGRSFWNALAMQAEANLAMSNAILSQSQRMVSNECVAAMEPDRLEMWYVADSDAADVAKIAGQIVERTNSLSFEKKHVGDFCEKPDLVAAVPSARCGFGSKRGVSSVLEQPTASGVNAAAEAADGNPNFLTKGRGGKNVKFKAKRGGGVEIVVDADGTGKSAKAAEVATAASMPAQKWAGIEASDDGSDESTIQKNPEVGRQRGKWQR